MTRSTPRAVPAAVALLLLVACDDGTGPAADLELQFDRENIALGQARTATIVVRNSGSSAVGPVAVVAGPVRRAGLDIPGVQLASAPEEIATLNPGDSATIQLAVTGAEDLQAGSYVSELEARVQGTKLATAMVSFSVSMPSAFIGSVDILDVPAVLRQGDLIQLSAIVYDTTGVEIEDAAVTWSTMPNGIGLFSAQDEFVPYQAGDIAIIATAGEKADTIERHIDARGLSGSFSVAGHTTLLSRFTSDVWVHGDVAYTGTWGTRWEPGNMMYAWNITGGTPVVTDSVRIQAYTIDDVMIRADGRLAVITHEYASQTHAITLLDMTDPEHPTVAGEYHADLESGWIGIHNAWLDGDYAYIVVDGAASNRGLWIIDILNPAQPHRVARFYAGSSFLHDVIVRDGLAFLSHWDAGLVILDVGNGIRGGSPSNPVEVSRIVTMGGDVHNAWYWPETGYVFIGEEDFGTPGRLHVVDASDLLHPVEVGSFRVPGDTPHNYWLDEDRGILYTSWYSQGVQAIDVSGRLLGSLELQGRLIASSIYDGTGPCPGATSGTCAWGPQLHDGFVYVADMNSGLWKLQPSF